MSSLSQSLLMCSSESFAVEYEINPWMSGQVGHISKPLTKAQWQSLHRQLAQLADVEVMDANPAWPDLVFTANAGLPLLQERRVVLSNFRHPQRQGEKAVNRQWFETHGWQCVELDAGICFEGGGDALFDSEERLFVADGLRTDRVAAASLAQYVTGSIHSLRLVDTAFYHLDTCFCPLNRGYALYLPQAFDASSQRLLEASFGAKLIALTPDEGHCFCANAVNIDSVIIMNEMPPRLAGVLAGAGFTAVATSLTEFMKSGGSAKCLTLRIK